MKTATALKLLVTAGALSFVMVSSRAEAATSCLNDVDCPEPACGGQVCDYTKGQTCQPAGGAPKGQDGWCTVDSDCKCMGMGATCNSIYCTFTTPPAGGTGGATGSGGASGTGGSSASGGSTSTGGSSASGGSTSTGGSTGSGGASGSGGAKGSGGATGTGGSSASGSSNSGGGCSVTGSGPASVLGVLFGLSVLGLRRLRRRT